MTICRFFLEGRCRYGNSCRNEHILSENRVFFGQNLRELEGNKGRINNYVISEEGIREDLGKNHPEWIFTSYGTGKGQANLISGKDISPEELRAFAYECAENMKFYDYKNKVERMTREMEDLRRNMIKNLRKTCKIANDINNGKFSGNVDVLFSNSQASKTVISEISMFLSRKPLERSFTESNRFFRENREDNFSILGKGNSTMENLFNKNDTKTISFGSNISNIPSFGVSNFSMAPIKPIFNNIMSNQNPSNFNNNSAFQMDSQMSNSPINPSTQVSCQSNIFNPTQIQSAFNSQTTFHQQPTIFNSSKENNSKTNDLIFPPKKTFESTFIFQQNSQEFSKNSPSIHNSQYTNHIEVVLLNQGAPDPLSESDLPAYALKEFKSHIFTLGKIPEMEPPLSLRG
ncbi:hypothetical protein T552_02132 [Pneumocystis carinii B80]|uniref:C3H1-type domain-containing protein n=1 Tax=Pneumocystis carinii (strain B80) TaxID=1408658 RepID=A0A0W4ZH51_PNEC8|nr:hypothetical protein T552_02132 [Pneumocystis carinii B80]KTW27692.1 hypothetical protein T552_02132 [Pneumocystis carinii B80]